MKRSKFREIRTKLLFTQWMIMLIGIIFMLISFETTALVFSSTAIVLLTLSLMIGLIIVAIEVTFKSKEKEG